MTLNLPAKSETVPSEHEIMVYHTMAEQAVSSKMYKGIGDKAGIMMIMLAARELGIPAMQALNGGLNIIQGKVEISARMMGALIRKAGHQIHVVENTDNLCTLTGKRCDTGESITTTFTVSDAQKAGIFKAGGGWTKWPKDMCFARALSRLARQLFPDVIGIGYVEGEIRAIEVHPEETYGTVESVPLSEKVVDVAAQDRFEELLWKFDKDDQHLIGEYVGVVMKHFGWTHAECVNKFLEEPNINEKFEAWKAKKAV